MSYPKILAWLAGTHGIPLARAQKLWDRAVAYSTALVGLTREGLPDWASVIAIFLEFARHEPQTRHARARWHSSRRGACAGIPSRTLSQPRSQALLR